MIRSKTGSRKSRKRVGRGNGSGRGTYCGRGVKGQKSRAGKRKGAQFEGGQTPLIRRQPKLGGFRSPKRVAYEIVNLDVLDGKFDSGSYDADDFAAIGIVRRNAPIKLLGRGHVTKKFNLKIHAASKSAKAAVEKAGGSITLL